MTLPFGLFQLPPSESGRGVPLSDPRFPLLAGTADDPTAGAAPAAASAAPAPWWQRLRDRLMPAPAAFAGLLSDADVAGARGQGVLGFGLDLLNSSGPVVGGPAPSLGQALAHGIQAGQQQYQAGVQGALGGQLARQQIEQTKARQAAREQIAAQYPAKPGETRAEMAERLLAMFNAYVQAGDLEMVGKLGEVLKSIGNDSTAARAPQEIRLGNTVKLRDPVTGKIVDEYPIGPSPRDPNAPDTAQQLRDQRMFQREQQLTDDYNKDTKAQRENAVTIKQTLNDVPRALAGDGASQISVLYAFVKAMDPTSAVREGEIGLAQAATPLWQQAQQMIARYSSGESVTVSPGMLRSMSSLMQRRLDAYGRYITERGQYYGARAKRWGLDADGLFPNIDLSTPAPTPAAAPAATGDANRVRSFLHR